MSQVSQQPGPETIGVIARSGLRGAIYPTRNWRLLGDTGLHALKFDCGRLGFGPMHLSVDGRVVAQFAKPGRKAPAIQTPPLTIDGKEVIAYAQSHNNGDSVTVDVFVDGVSLENGKSLTSIAGRAAVAKLASARYKSPMDPVFFARVTVRRVTLWASGLGALRIVIVAAQSSLVRAGSTGLWLLCLWLTGSVSLRLLSRVAQGRQRGIRAGAIALGWVCINAAALLILLIMESHLV